MIFAYLHLALVAGLSAFLTLASIVYARLIGMFDEAGQRRVHVRATPRGGGVGMVLLFAVALLWLWMDGVQWALPCVLALVAVALVGFVDDHRALPALPRLIVHVLAGILLAMAFPLNLPGMPAWVAAALLVPAVVWSINLYNFMDGINGMAAGHAVVVFAGLGLLAFELGAPTISSLSFLMSAAALGFLPFNAPRAFVFMGDVASGSLGLVFAMLAVALIVHSPRAWALVLLLHSAFLIDAGMTLLMRMLRGRRWYSAHREHLYQWLVRSGWPHWAVSLLYLTWTCLMLALSLWLVESPAPAPVLAVAVVLLAAGLWWGARHWVLRCVRIRS